MSKVLMSIRIDDCGGYFQVYKVVPALVGPRGGKRVSGYEAKLGNIYPPGYESFGEVHDKDLWVATTGGGDKVKWQNLDRALAYLISPRGMT